MAGRLAELLNEVAAGAFPPPDGSVTVLPQSSSRDTGVIGFTAHAVVFTDLDPAWVMDQLPADDLAAPLNPPFLSLLSQHSGRRVNSIDVLCVAGSSPGPPSVPLTQVTAADHPRAVRARRYRDDVRVWTGAGGIVVLGRGVAGRWEVAIEVPPGQRGRGHGRELAGAARSLVPAGEPLWAQVAAGNAASMRAFLAAGFVPVGVEALLVPA